MISVSFIFTVALKHELAFFPSVTEYVQKQRKRGSVCLCLCFHGFQSLPKERNSSCHGGQETENSGRDQGKIQLPSAVPQYHASSSTAPPSNNAILL